ncbi:hypothetical protein FBUS_05070 [Fasciolopsis buskii]|uniref:Uncharacterized protein n=1 Tax=Fasciolopsis buskii TaxID=27845 RepID=A0A8E0RPB7_9TREM|nr:hypothetical protein FBUS_05070 [Fasciolopsis buski]
MQTGTGELVSKALIKQSPNPSNHPILYACRTQHLPLIRERRISHTVPPSPIRSGYKDKQTPKRSSMFEPNESERVIFVRPVGKVKLSHLAKSQEGDEIKEALQDIT